MAALTWVPQRGEVIYINHSPAAASEIPNEHPMLVITTQNFNEKTGLLIGLSLTHSELHARNPFAIPLRDGNRTSYLVCNQPRTFAWAGERAGRPHPWGMKIKDKLDEALGILGEIIGLPGT